MTITTYRAGIDIRGENILRQHSSPANDIHALYLASVPQSTVTVADFRPSSEFDVTIPIDASGDYMRVIDNGVTTYYFLTPTREAPIAGQNEEGVAVEYITVHASIDVPHSIRLTDNSVWDFKDASRLLQGHTFMLSGGLLTGQTTPAVTTYDAACYAKPSALAVSVADVKYTILIRAVVKPYLFAAESSDYFEWLMLTADNYEDMRNILLEILPQFSRIRFEDPDNPGQFENVYSAFEFSAVYVFPHAYIGSNWDSYTKAAEMIDRGATPKSKTCRHFIDSPKIWQWSKAITPGLWAVGNPSNMVELPQYCINQYIYAQISLDVYNSAFYFSVIINGKIHDFTDSLKAPFLSPNESALSNRNFDRIIGGVGLAASYAAALSGAASGNPVAIALGASQVLTGAASFARNALQTDNYMVESDGGAFFAQTDNAFRTPFETDTAYGSLIHDVLFLYEGIPTSESNSVVNMNGAVGVWKFPTLGTGSKNFFFFRGDVFPFVKESASGALARFARSYTDFVRNILAYGVRVWGSASRYLEDTEWEDLDE